MYIPKRFYIFLKYSALMIGILLFSITYCTASPITILNAKKLPNGADVELTSKVVTAVFSGAFYVEEPDHSFGIRVISSNVPLLGQTADVTGKMATNDAFERQIVASSTVFRGYDPPSIANNQVGGDNLLYNSSNGAGQRGVPMADGLPNNIGQLVKTSGTVTMGKPGDAADFPIDDGTHAALLIVLPSGVTNPGYGAHVTVTGISSLKNMAGVTRRAVLLRGPQDLHVDQPAPECKYADEMVYVATGEFDMGIERNPNDGDTYHLSPKHKVHMDGYWIGKYEVTRAEYQKFIDAGGYSSSQYWTPEGWWWKLQYRNSLPAFWNAWWVQEDDYPVIGISPFEMDAYCKWAGVRRTSEAEWEKAACWDPVAKHSRKYPWGDVWDANKCNNAFDMIGLYYDKTSPVGFYTNGVSYYGCFDMAGNVFEWCRGYYTADWYSHPPTVGWINPDPNEKPEYDFYGLQCYRGGSFYPYEYEQRSYNRFGQYPYLYNADIGFRVVR